MGEVRSLAQGQGLVIGLVSFEGMGGALSGPPPRAPFLVITMSFCFTGLLCSPQGT